MTNASVFTETWSLQKPAVSSAHGVVVSQHYKASEVGARVLREGGNAVDAAVATGLALGAVEPWMSGIGGCGNMLFYEAKTDRCHALSFGVRAPLTLDPANYPLAGGQAADLFAWPAVVEDRNVYGPMSIAVPGYVAGVDQALSRFGSLSFAAALAPAIELARAGMDVDWYASLKIASSSSILARYEPGRSIYLDDGQAPMGEWGGALPHIHLGALADTLELLATRGADDFYHGELARRIAADAGLAGSCLSVDDLAQYQVTESDAVDYAYAGSRVMTVGGMTAGPTLNYALQLLNDDPTTDSAAATTDSDEQPSSARYRAIAASLHTAYQERLRNMGDADESTSPSCTTHISVVDKDGNTVSLTQTLLSLFGSKVVLPDTGILMNNGLMWFDPRPGQPNSMAAGRWPLSNMCPTIVKTDDQTIALGASGGRRIMPAVFQLLSFLVDQKMTLEQAAHHPRIDVSGSSEFTVDERLPQGLLEDLDDCSVLRAPNGVYPALFACPNMAAYRHADGVAEGAAFVASPWAKASAGSTSS